MPEEQDDTILILGGSTEKNEPPASQTLNTVHEDGFKTVLEEACSAYVILTSVKAFTYRVEVFEAEELIDAIELECKDLGKGLDDAALFLQRYTAAHEKFKQKVCTNRQSQRAENPRPKVEMPVENRQMQEPKPSQQYIPKMQHTEKGSSMGEGKMTFSSDFSAIWQKFQEKFSELKEKQGFKLGVVLLAVVLTVLLLGRLLLCQLDTFLDKEEKVSYYKQTESFCHKLEKGCDGLMNSKMVDETLFTPEHCEAYCSEGTIPFERCEEFLDYFKANKMFEKRKGLVENAVPEQAGETVEAKAEEKIVFLQTEPFELVLGKAFSLSVENLGRQVSVVQVKNLLVNESEHDEIVQFSAGVSKLNIAPDETKKFKLFLEESYYRQFAKGKYTGSIVFSLLFEKGKKERVTKAFFFEVK